MMMNCFSGMVNRRKAFSLISSWDHSQKSSPSRILSSSFAERGCALVITTAPRHHNKLEQ